MTTAPAPPLSLIEKLLAMPDVEEAPPKCRFICNAYAGEIEKGIVDLQAMLMCDNKSQKVFVRHEPHSDMYYYTPVDEHQCHK